MEQMKVYKDFSFSRYENLPLSQRRMYWLDYLNRLVQFSLYDPDMSTEKHDRLLTEISRVTAIIKVLQNEPITRTIESQATKEPPSEAEVVGYASTKPNKNVRPSSKRRPARRSNRARKTARTDNSK